MIFCAVLFCNRFMYSCCSHQSRRGVEIKELYRATFLLSAAGDALGYRHGKWEFCHSGEQIQEELRNLGGLNAIHLSGPEWIISDDTVMHLATAEALVENDEQKGDTKSLFSRIALKYKECMTDMKGRAAGITCIESAKLLQPGEPDGYQIPFNKNHGGCGAAMRSMCIGLRYPCPEEIDKLISVSIESGRMTHHHPTGYLGSLVAALFTSYAIQGKPAKEWGISLLEVLPKAKQYIQDQQRYVQENMEAWNYFTEQWKKYLKKRGLLDEPHQLRMDGVDNVKSRDEFYKSLSFAGLGGASGHDAPMIAYDALLAAGDDWEELCLRGVLHGGDNDSTGAIAGAWFGASYGLKGVPRGHFENIEYRERLEDMAHKIYSAKHQQVSAL